MIPDRSGTTIVVNDDLVQLRLATALLEKDGMRVMPFLTAEEAPS